MLKGAFVEYCKVKFNAIKKKIWEKKFVNRVK